MVSSEKNTHNNQIHHIVCFKFKKNTTKIEIENLRDSFLTLKNKIPGVIRISGGENNSPENLNKGFTHCFLIIFEDEQARKEYLPHHEHQIFISQLKPIMEDVFVIDYEFKI
jgi:hypothetical protein